MAFNETLADRVREELAIVVPDLEEKRMFGGLCFMVRGKLCVGIMGDQLLVRLDPTRVETVLELEGVRPMDFSGRSMKGFVLVATAVLPTRTRLGYWLQEALAYNPQAKASRKKK